MYQSSPGGCHASASSEKVSAVALSLNAKGMLSWTHQIALSLVPKRKLTWRYHLSNCRGSFRYPLQQWMNYSQLLVGEGKK